MKGLFQGVGGGECGEVGEHDVTHAKRVGLGVEQEAGVVHVGSDEDEAADHDEPHVGQDAAGDSEDEADDLAEAGGGACALHDAVAAGELATEDAATVEGGGGEKVDGGEEEVDPDDGAKQVRGGEPGAFEQVDLWRYGDDDGPEDETEEEVGDGADDAEALADLRRRGAFGGFRCGVLLQAAGWKKEDTAKLEAVPGGCDGASDLADGDGEEEEDPEEEAAAAGGAGDR